MQSKLSPNQFIKELRFIIESLIQLFQDFCIKKCPETFFAELSLFSDPLLLTLYADVFHSFICSDDYGSHKFSINNFLALLSSDVLFKLPQSVILNQSFMFSVQFLL